MSGDRETAVVLAAHGVPPLDYPPRRVGLLMALEFSGRLVERLGFLRRWRDRLEREVRQWPRCPANDPYRAAVEELARKLTERLNRPVFVGYNEFCAPDVGEAIEGAISGGARRVVVVPTMLVRGNTHTEKEIRAAVEDVRARHPEADIRYAWPFDEGRVADLLAEQVRMWLQGEK